MTIASDQIDPKYRARMNELAAVLDVFFNEGAKGKDRTIGFAIFMFEFGKITDGRVNYISNASRTDMITAVKEWLARAEGRVIETDTKQ